MSSYEKALCSLMEERGMSRDEAHQYIVDAVASWFVREHKAGRIACMLTPEEVEAVQEAERRGLPVPGAIYQKYLDPRSDIVGGAIAAAQVEDSFE